MHLSTLAATELTRIGGGRSKIVLGGDGIEGRYMRSRDKCKPRYQGIWAAARKRGVEYRGLMTHDELFKLYDQSRVMLDLSYSKKFAALGSHFNRSTLEGISRGLIPVVTGVNMIDNFDAQRTIWVDGKSHVGVPVDAEPFQIAVAVKDTLSLSEITAGKMRKFGQNILREFEYRKFADDLIELSEGNNCGIYPELENGYMPSEFYKFAKRFAQENAK
jgi:glycosyltransferase involved in cell wall biosynthesis